MTKYRILKNLIAHGGSMGYTDLLNLHKRRPLQTKGNCIALRDSGFIRGDFTANSVVSVTPAGYLFNGCDDLSGAPSCVECRLRSIELFQQQFPALPLYID